MYFNRDKLTGLYQEDYFKFRLEEEVIRNLRYKRDMTLIFLEVDFNYFVKDIDLRSGFSYSILRQIGKFVRDSIRRIDIAGRLGGDCFAVILPETPEEGALVLAERMRKLVEAFVFKGSPEAPELKVAVNVGIVAFPRHGKSPEELLSVVQRALLMAREEGGNMVKIYPEALYEEEPSGGK
ncbi:MAG: GGDEF domain-containing protein [Candidatus Eremiobacteraeota bacterium]|nr:GGDEF domain-containing protein [Candidatus Eremiobacteraeota bacterium]